KGRVALVFGRENHGLSNDELQRCHYHIHIPSNPDYSSLNLAMAVQVICYELRMQYLRGLEEGESSPYLEAMVAPGDNGWDVPPATVNDVEGFFGHLEQVLVDVNFHRRDNPRQLMSRLRRLFQRARMDEMEINILRGVLSAVQKTAGTQQGGMKHKPTAESSADEGREYGHVRAFKGRHQQRIPSGSGGTEHLRGACQLSRSACLVIPPAGSLSLEPGAEVAGPNPVYPGPLVYRYRDSSGRNHWPAVLY